MAKWKWGILAAAVALCAAVGIFYLNYHNPTTIKSFNDCAGAGYPVSQTYPLQCEANGQIFVQEESDPTKVAVENVVTNFGGVMQLVSVNTSKTLASQAISDNYRDLVSPALLAAWMDDPANAPGRTVSSPWPDHIGITSITAINTTTYMVTGDVIELTNNNVAHGGVADEYAVTTTVAIVDGNWMLTGWDSSR